MQKTLRILVSFILLGTTGIVNAENDIGNLCVPIGSWAIPSSGHSATVPPIKLISNLALRPVVLLGETHDSFEHHRWQLQTIAALHAQHPDMVLGFEMFPRRVQAVLDRWVAGELTEKEFLEQSEWDKVWNFDPALYLPIFHFARMNRIPMLALNVDLKLAVMVGEKGWEGIPKEMREGLSDPAPPSQAYLDDLSQAFRAHSQFTPHASANPSSDTFDFNNPEFRRFVQSQQVWDRAMAEAISGVVHKPNPPLLIGIIGAGHVMNRYGVPHQLADLGVTDVAVLLPWDAQRECGELTPDLADAVFGVDAPAEVEEHKPRLGLAIAKTERGVEVKQVQKGGLADITGIRNLDIVTEIAGVKVTDGSEISKIVQRQAPGTWLPIKIKRGTQEMELVAKFPAQK